MGFKKLGELKTVLVVLILILLLIVPGGAGATTQGPPPDSGVQAPEPPPAPLESGEESVYGGSQTVSYQFNVTIPVVDENSGSAAITFTRLNNLDKVVEVVYATADDSAAAGSDYTATTGKLVFNPGETSKTFTIPLIDDSLPESDERFKITLTPKVGGITLGPMTAFLIIKDDDFPLEFESAVVKNASLGLSYNKVLNPAPIPAARDFTIFTDGSNPVEVTAVAVYNKLVLLTLGTAVKYGQPVTLNYRAGSTPIKDNSGNVAENIYDLPVTNLTPGSPNSNGGGGGGGGAPATIPPPSESKSFEDIVNHWAQKDIEELAAKGIVKGLAENRFAPDNKITRAEFTALLVRALNLPKTSENCPFKDVLAGNWYHEVVKTAYNNDLVTGSQGYFQPQDKITREEMVVMLVRALEKVGKKPLPVTPNNILSAFKDYQELSLWAKDALLKAFNLELIKGKEENKLAPRTTATRAEGVVLIKRLLTLI